MSDKPEGAGQTETADSRNSSLKSTSPDKCNSVSDKIIQKPHPVGDQVSPAVKG